MSENKYTLWGLIKYLIGLFFSGKKRERQKHKEQFKNISEGLKEDYEEVDEKKESKKSEDVEKRLENLF